MRILLVSPGVVASFVRQDFEFLAGEFAASLFIYQGARSLPALRRAVAGADAVVIWFAGRHAVPAVAMARARRIPVATIVGGYEVAWVPEISYGNRPGTLRHRLVRWIFRASDLVLTVSQASHDETRRAVPERTSGFKLIYNAVDSESFDFCETTDRETILTVGFIGRQTIAKKGFGLFWETAASMPDLDFVAVGPATDEDAKRLTANCPPNLTWTGPLQGEDLVRRFQSARVYFQGSWHESFSLATAEAMACGCIPVVSRMGALPEVAGDTGVYIEALTPEAAAAAIRTALALPDTHRAAARQRIVEHFGAERRQRELCAAIREMIALHKAGRRPRDNSETDR